MRLREARQLASVAAVCTCAAARDAACLASGRSHVLGIQACLGLDALDLRE